MEFSSNVKALSRLDVGYLSKQLFDIFNFMRNTYVDFSDKFYSENIIPVDKHNKINVSELALAAELFDTMGVNLDETPIDTRVLGYNFNNLLEDIQFVLASLVNSVRSYILAIDGEYYDTYDYEDANDIEKYSFKIIIDIKTLVTKLNDLLVDEESDKSYDIEYSLAKNNDKRYIYINELYRTVFDTLSKACTILLYMCSDVSELSLKEDLTRS